MGGKIDKDKNTQVLVTISHDMLKLIEDYQFDNRIKNRSEAIRTLITKGLEKG
ncbi:ribbon-helix-helix domain-containing protein [Metabacillus sp. B2-18]|uniref:ribbon-helix-helix domain-containing protein n=1 Tax=Metabacillus sp. B2-18 TaxID=2897333 RepID=UPI001E39168C|nr:ribbon-helix-helix domain-containing protein [Metabacillus sp. B2-18]UGB31679.1 ribbon-helix-helix domain-containing protein [Metabacillus sp. B2-18]